MKCGARRVPGAKDAETLAAVGAGVGAGVGAVGAEKYIRVTQMLQGSEGYDTPPGWPGVHTSEKYGIFESDVITIF